MNKQLSFLKRGSLTRHPTAQKLFKIMTEKESNLCLAADVTSQDQLLGLADELGPYLSVLKTHVDLLTDFTPEFAPLIRKLSQKHNFLIFEDRKFADIGQTVSLQYTRGIYRIHDWAHLINAHIVPGPGVIEGLKGSSLLLLAEMSSSGTLAKGAYAKKAVEMAEDHLDTVVGFISLRKLSQNPGLIHFTPGVKLKAGEDSMGQKYRTVEEVLIKNRSDIIIVGRDITQSANPKKQAALYREKGWNNYVKTIS